MPEQKKLTKKQLMSRRAWLRRGVQLVFFLASPGAFIAAFSGAKYIFTTIGQGKAIEAVPFFKILVGLCLFTVLFGRFFCGFACAFGALGDWLHDLYVFICRKRKKKTYLLPAEAARVLPWAKYGLLAILLLACLAGVYGNLTGSSPWDVFSMIRAGRLRLAGYGIGAVLLVLILIGMTLTERFFCRFFCPMGAIFALLPVLPFFSLHRNRKACLPRCSACTKTCPSGIELPSDGSVRIEGDCFQCQKCIGICPKSNVHTGVGQLRGDEIPFTLLRAALLLAMLVLLG